MFPFTEQFSAATKSQVETQLKIINLVASKTFDSAHQLIALNLNATRASLDRTSETAKHLLTLSSPRDLLAPGSLAVPNFDNLVAYSREWFNIASRAQAELIEGARDQLRDNAVKPLTLVPPSKPAPEPVQTAAPTIVPAPVVTPAATPVTVVVEAAPSAVTPPTPPVPAVAASAPVAAPATVPVSVPAAAVTPAAPAPKAAAKGEVKPDLKADTKVETKSKPATVTAPAAAAPEPQSKPVASAKPAPAAVTEPKPVVLKSVGASSKSKK